MAMFIDGTTVQVIILGLVVLDVICVICELIIVGTKCGGDCQDCAEETYMCILEGIGDNAHGTDYATANCEDGTVHRMLSFGMRLLGGNTTDRNMGCAQVEHHRILSVAAGVHADCAFHDHHELTPTQVLQ
jgi:hypothetical protein